MWKALIAGTTILTIAGSTLASAQQPTAAERPHHAQLTADDIAAFTDARIGALKPATLKAPTSEMFSPWLCGTRSTTRTPGAARP